MVQSIPGQIETWRPTIGADAAGRAALSLSCGARGRPGRAAAL